MIKLVVKLILKLHIIYFHWLLGHRNAVWRKYNNILNSSQALPTKAPHKGLSYCRDAVLNVIWSQVYLMKCPLSLSTVSSVNCDSRRSLRHCVNMAPVCRTKGESVWRWIETQLETEETFWENCQCPCVLAPQDNRYMVKTTSVEALRLEY